MKRKGRKHLAKVGTKQDLAWERKEGEQVYLAERHRGTFRRQVHLGDGLDAERIEARYNDGVLTLRIPVAEAAQPKKIQVQTGSSSRAIDTSTSEPSRS